MLNLITVVALLGLGGAFYLLAWLDAGLSLRGQAYLLGLGTLAWLLTYPLMF